MKLPIKSLSLGLVLALSISGCSSFSGSSRRQRAYAKYVRKSSGARMKQPRLRSPKPSMPPQPVPSEPVENRESSPQSMPSEEPGGNQ